MRFICENKKCKHLWSAFEEPICPKCNTEHKMGMARKHMQEMMLSEANRLAKKERYGKLF
jgi:hypothetical protein